MIKYLKRDNYYQKNEGLISIYIFFWSFNNAKMEPTLKSIFEANATGWFFEVKRLKLKSELIISLNLNVRKLIDFHPR